MFKTVFAAAILALTFGVSLSSAPAEAHGYRYSYGGYSGYNSYNSYTTYNTYRGYRCGYYGC